MHKFLFVFLLVGCDLPPRTSAHYDCARGYSFYHKLGAGEDYQCPKEYKQEQVWKDTSLGFGRAPTDLVECTCIPKYY